MIRINLLRDRAAERFAKALVPDAVLTLSDIRRMKDEFLRPDRLVRLNQRDEYICYVSTKTFNHLRRMDMKIKKAVLKWSIGEFDSIRIIQSKPLP